MGRAYLEKSIIVLLIEDAEATDGKGHEDIDARRDAMITVIQEALRAHRQG